MRVYEAIMKRRSIRKFKQTSVPREALLRLVDCARVTAYGANLQPLKFGVITSAALREKIFPLTKWAAYLDNGTPAEDERPMAYIAVFADHRIKEGGCMTDVGAAEAVISLEAEELGLGVCILGALQLEALTEIFQLPVYMELVHLIALGYPAQQSRPVDMEDSVRYYLDQEDILCVPKRSLQEVIFFSDGAV